MDMVAPKGLGFLSYGEEGLRGTDGLTPGSLVGHSLLSTVIAFCLQGCFDWFERRLLLCPYPTTGDERWVNSEHEALERGGLDAVEWLASLQ
jgi:hypothetical protein